MGAEPRALPTRQPYTNPECRACTAAGTRTSTIYRRNKTEMGQRRSYLSTRRRTPMNLEKNSLYRAAPSLPLAFRAPSGIRPPFEDVRIREVEWLLQHDLVI